MFHDPLILYIALLAVPVSALTGVAVMKRLYVGPLRFKEPDYFFDLFGGPFVGSLGFDRAGGADIEVSDDEDADDESDASDNGHNDTRGVSATTLQGLRVNSVGMIGELLTSLIMIQRGWRQLPSQPKKNGNGLDAIFIRRVRDRSGGYEVCLAETKTTTRVNKTVFDTDYKPARMSTKAILQDISTLKTLQAAGGPRKYLALDVADAISAALNDNSRYVSRLLFFHSFSRTMTMVYELDPEGEIAEREPESIADAAHKNLLEALEIGLARTVRKLGKQNPPAAAIIDYKKVVMQDGASPSPGPRLHHRLGVKH